MVSYVKLKDERRVKRLPPPAFLPCETLRYKVKDEFIAFLDHRQERKNEAGTANVVPCSIDSRD